MFSFILSLAHVQYAIMEEAGSMTYTTASHQGTCEIFWLHFWGTHVVRLYTVYGNCGTRNFLNEPPK